MNRIWGKVGKLAGGFLLFSGGSVSLALLVGIVASQASGVGLAILASLLVLFGLSPALLGAFFLHTALRADRQVIQEQFWQLVRIKQGRLSLLDFTVAARLEPAIARRYLDQWAREFDADFEVNDRGDVYYVFAAERLPLPENRTTAQVVEQVMRQWLHE